MSYRPTVDNCLSIRPDDGLLDRQAFGQLCARASTSVERLAALKADGGLPLLTLPGRRDDLDAIAPLAERFAAELDDVVVLGQPDIPSSFAATLINNGFQLDRKAGELALYHRDGAPRAYSVPREILGIGRGAQNLALFFPEVMVGQSEYLDEYDQDLLNQFNQLFLAGCKWRDLAQAEERVRSFLEQGGERVVVDLTGVPNQILSRQPKFLNVYGEQVLAVEQVNLVDAAKIDSLEPFAPDGKPWVPNDPQGVDEVLVRFTYPVPTAPHWA